jgi:hypothetical protein
MQEGNKGGGKKEDGEEKVKWPLCLTNQALCHEGVWMDGGCIDPCFLNLCTRWR